MNENNEISTEELHEINEERKYLGGLLKDRMNFYLVFVSLFLLGAYKVPLPYEKFFVLLFGTIVSFLLYLSVLRTHILVRKALIILKHSPSAYNRLQKNVGFPSDANKILIVVPIILTALFVGLSVSALVEWLKNTS